MLLVLGRYTRLSGSSDKSDKASSRDAPRLKGTRLRGVLGRRRLLISLAGSALVLGIVGFGIWPGYTFIETAESPTGGVLILHDRLPIENDRSIVGQPVDIEVEMWTTGVPGVSMLALRMNFQQPQPEDNWYVIASGDYVVDSSRDLTLFCKYGDGQLLAEEVRCNAQAGNPQMEFAFDQQLGFTGAAEVTNSISELQGYNRERVTVVRGEMPAVNELGEYIVDVYLPISSPTTKTVNGDEFVSVLPVAPNLRSFASGPPLDESCLLATPQIHSLFALTPNCAPVTQVQVRSITVDPGFEVGNRTVEYSAPDTVSDDVVKWSLDGGFPGAKALISDPFAKEDESRRAFIAALVLSLSVSFALLLIERLMFHRRDH